MKKKIHYSDEFKLISLIKTGVPNADKIFEAVKDFTFSDLKKLAEELKMLSKGYPA